MDIQFIISFLSIVVIDLVLAGDNAVVIAMAAHRLEPTQRKRAICSAATGSPASWTGIPGWQRWGRESWGGPQGR
jgi:hypothetical protein